MGMGTGEQKEEKEEEMNDIEGTKDYYQHLLNLLKFAIKKFVGSHIPPEFVDEFVEDKIDKCLKEYGVDWKLDEEGK